MKKFFLILFSYAIISTTIVFAQENSQPDKDNIQDNSIVVPESLNEQLATLLHEWQIDFSKSDNTCRQGANVVFPDSVYTQCLYDMPTEMELSYNQVVRQYIDMYVNRRRDVVGYMLTIGKYYFPMFEEALDKQGLPLELKYLPVIESALNPVAVSRMGATGLWQFMLRTGKGYGLQVNSLVDERRDPHKSTEAAARYLKDLYAIYGDWNLVIAAYNCGPGNVNKAIARSGGKRDYWQIYYNLPRETRGYVPAFIAANYIMNFYDKHNICPVESFQEMTALDTVHVENQVHFNQIAEVLDIPLNDIRRWNPQFKKDRVPGNYQRYALVLPTNKMYAFLEKKDEIMNFRRNEYITHRENTDGYLALSGSSVSGNKENVYYRVRSGDNLGKIARKNKVTVAQLKSWNGLRSDRLSIGKRLIVKKKTVIVEEPQPVQQTVETTASAKDSSSIISDYLKQQLGESTTDETEVVAGVSMETE